ncbi:MAG: Ig-like domain-containing protein, partial [Methanosarcinales archaeon]|nr:Ig-like domain-containing protein [Methanosarcinales archaeon]
MRLKEARSIVIAAAMLCIFAQSAVSTSTISLEPAYIDVWQDDEFTVNVTVDSAENEVYGASYTLHFDNTLLNATTQAKGPFLTHDGAISNIYKDEINNTIGEIIYAETRTGATAGVTDPGVLATITFQVIGEEGVCSLNVSDLDGGLLYSIYGSVPTDIYNGRVGIAQTQSPFVISGYAFNEDESDCNDPAVNITNLNIGKEWAAGTDASSNYYQLTLASCADVIAGEVLRFEVTSPDGSQNTTEHTVTQDEVNGGGIFSFNITLASSAAPTPTLVEYTISNRTITPPQTTEIDVEFSERVKWKIAIENGGVVYDWTGTSTNPTKKPWNGTYEENGTTVPDGAYVVNITWTNTTTGLGDQNNTKTITVSAQPVSPPASITNLHNITYEETYINWTWDDPTDANFSKVMVYLDGAYMEDVSKGTQHYNATGLAPDTEHEIGTHTVDNAGNINETWVDHTARTKPSSDTTSPTITAHSPTGTGVPVTTDVTVTFDEAMNQTSAKGAFSILPDVDGAFSWSGNTMIFTPAADLADNTAYDVTISTDAKDLAGNPLAEPFTWNFTTAVHVPPSTTVSIEEITVAIDGNVTVPIWINSVTNLGGCEINMTYNASVVHVTDVTPGDMNDSFAPNFDNGSGWMRANAVNATGLSGNVVFAYVNFTAVGGDGDISPLNITVEDLFDVGYDNITHTVINGTFTIGTEDSESPRVTDANASRDTILNDNGRPRALGTNVTVLNVTVTDSGSGVANVTINLSSIGGSLVQPMERIDGTDIWTVTTNATAGINL